MKPLESPIQRGDLSPNRWYHFLIGPRWQQYFASLKRQMKDRGAVSPEVWGDAERLEIATQIEAILEDCCWGEPMHFHPDDPWRVVGEYEIGDLSEIEALEEIGDKFGVELSIDVMLSFFDREPTFGDFVDFIREKQHSRK